MVRAVAAAAGGQRRIVSIEGGRKRAEAEEEDEQNGESAAHLAFIVHELWIGSRFEEAYGLQVSSFHLEFPLLD